jgi:hypothetical protein
MSSFGKRISLNILAIEAELHPRLPNMPDKVWEEMKL